MRALYEDALYEGRAKDKIINIAFFKGVGRYEIVCDLKHKCTWYSLFDEEEIITKNVDSRASFSDVVEKIMDFDFKLVEEEREIVTVIECYIKIMKHFHKQELRKYIDPREMIRFMGH